MTSINNVLIVIFWYNFIHGLPYLCFAYIFCDILLLIDKPGTPSNLTAQSTTANSIYLTWTTPKTNAFLGTVFYRVHYRHSTETLLIKNVSSATMYNLTGLIQATTYTIFITAANKYFESDPSDHINQTTTVAGTYQRYFL